MEEEIKQKKFLYSYYEVRKVKVSGHVYASSEEEARDKVSLFDTDALYIDQESEVLFIEDPIEIYTDD